MPQTALPKKIGLIAGGGDAPHRVLSACQRQGIDVFIIALDGHAEKTLTAGQAHTCVRLGQMAKIIDILRSENIQDLVFIGHVRRPSLPELMPDAKALEFLKETGAKALSGDSDMLSALRGFLEKEGFSLHGAHHFAPDLLAPEGVLGHYAPTEDDHRDINRGFELSQVLGAQDVGQSVVVQQGLVLGVEAIEGTDALIKRCASLQRKGRGAILVKSCKPQQDRDLDLPTIGAKTLKAIHKAGFSGLAIHAGQALIVDRQAVIAYADKHKLFICGISKA